MKRILASALLTVTAAGCAVSTQQEQPLLRRGSQPAGHIAEAFPVSRPAISKHLRLLRRARLVREHREGRNRIYRLNPEPLRAVDSWIEQYRTFWSHSLANLKSFVEAEHTREKQASRKPK